MCETMHTQMNVLQIARNCLRWQSGMLLVMIFKGNQNKQL